MLMRQQAAQETRIRLLQHQEQQQVIVPSNTSVTQPTSYQNIDDLFNNTVAPNVNVTIQVI